MFVKINSLCYNMIIYKKDKLLIILIYIYISNLNVMDIYNLFSTIFIRCWNF